MIVAIDGPAGSGKSSTAREVARRLGFLHVDSGAWYRALTHALLSGGVPEDRWDGLTPDDLGQLEVGAEREGDRIQMRVGGEPVRDELRTPDVNAGVSHVARVPAVREWLLTRLRELAGGGNVVADGRDIGTIVLPDAPLKVFLIADPEVRARRRLRDHGVDDPDAAALREEVDRLMERDRLDSQREVAPLKRAEDAVTVDTTALTFEEQVEAIVSLARTRRAR